MSELGIEYSQFCLYPYYITTFDKFLFNPTIMLHSLFSIKAVLFILIFHFSIVAKSQEGEPDAAKEAQNPLGNVISLPFQNNNDFGVGSYSKTNHEVNIKPIIPILVGKMGWLMKNRLIVPFPKSFADGSSVGAKNITGLGDISYTVWFAPPRRATLHGDLELRLFYLPQASQNWAKKNYLLDRQWFWFMPLQNLLGLR